MARIFVGIDLQDDFITGALGSEEAQKIIPYIMQKLKDNKYEYYYMTQDTHNKNYLIETLEGKMLPIPHCIEGTDGWYFNDDILELMPIGYRIIEKNTFGGLGLGDNLKYTFSNKWINEKDAVIEICGLCTDVCVVSNALLLRAYFPDARIICDAKACAGTSPEAHKAALQVMKSCQIEVINED